VAPPQELYRRPANLFVAAFIGSPAMNLITCTVGGARERPVVSFAGHTLALDGRVLGEYPGIADRIGSDIILGLRPEHFALEGDIDVPADQILTLPVELAESMGAEVHIHSSIDVPPVSVDGVETAGDDDTIDTSRTKLIARVDGIHDVVGGSTVRLAVKTHLAHAFDPASGAPLR
jgi:multiple sugar transport system ATP-binding protein